jgi:hypothetical protein
MRKIFIILFFVSSQLLAATEILFHGSSLTYAPTDKGIGLRHEISFGKTGSYGSISKGSYILKDNSIIKSHIKASFGIVRYCQSVFYDFRNTFSIGMNVHYYNGYEAFNPCLKKFSFEIGTGAIIIRKINIGFVYDPYTNQGQVHLGILFNQ